MSIGNPSVSHSSALRWLAACVAAVLTLGFSAASADYRPPYCPEQHDHRAHNANYYDYYPVRGGNQYNDRDRYNDRNRYDNRYRGDRYNNGYQQSRVVSRNVIPTRYRAEIIVVERVQAGGRRGGFRECTVSVRGPEARYVPYNRLQQVAYRNCSRNAVVRILA